MNCTNAYWNDSTGRSGFEPKGSASQPDEDILFCMRRHRILGGSYKVNALMWSMTFFNPSECSLISCFFMNVVKLKLSMSDWSDSFRDSELKCLRICVTILSKGIREEQCARKYCRAGSEIALKKTTTSESDQGIVARCKFHNLEWECQLTVRVLQKTCGHGNNTQLRDFSYFGHNVRHRVMQFGSWMNECERIDGILVHALLSLVEEHLRKTLRHF